MLSQLQVAKHLSGDIKFRDNLALVKSAVLVALERDVYCIAQAVTRWWDSRSSVGKLSAEQTEMSRYPNPTALCCPDRMGAALNQIIVRKKDLFNV